MNHKAESQICVILGLMTFWFKVDFYVSDFFTWIALVGFLIIHVDLNTRKYKDVIDGEDVSITKLKAKFVSYWS